MILFFRNFILDFYKKNIFERIIVYIFLSGFLVTFIFEFLLGQWSFIQSQSFQWFFYAFLAIDYLVSFRKVINIQVSFNPASALAVVFIIMMVHGLFIGIMNHNSAFIILNDTVPPLMIALNILRMQSAYENMQPIDIDFLLKVCVLLGFGATALSFISIQMGNPSDTAIIGGPVYYPLLFSCLFAFPKFPKLLALLAAFTVILALTEMNRTTMMFSLTVFSGYAAYQLIKYPTKAFIIIMAAAIFIAVAWVSIPENSKTYNRITNLAAVDLDRRTGSIGERQAEWDAIRAKLEYEGKTAQWLGLGFGGTYEVQFTHQYITDYGHAHYAWAWFNLRFGKSGYIYMIFMISILAYNGIRSLLLRNELGLFIAFMCFIGLIYCVTHVNSVFLLSGLHFMYPRSSKTCWESAKRAS